MLYRYVQTEERGTWLPVQVNKHFDDEVEKLGAVRTSVLAVSDVVRDDTDPAELGYFGPLYFDIDMAGNLNLAISSTQELVYKLRELQVPDEGIQVFCSGSKGFHVFVPETLFLTTQRAIKGLPSIYMEIARDLYVLGMDFAVYSAGRGRMFRPVDSQRPDGKYRVRITLDELDEMTPESYAKMVSAPRGLSLKGPNGHRSHALQALFDRARRRAASKATLRGTALPLEQLAPYAEEPPACIDNLTKYEVKRGVNFNVAGLQLAAFLARAGSPSYKADSLVTQMAENGESKTYNSVVKRKVHLHGLVSYAKAKPTLAFSCAAMRSVVGGEGCKLCPLNNKDLMNSTEVDPEDGAVLGMMAQPEGYYLKREKGESRITTFTLHPLEVYLDAPQSAGSTPRRVGTEMEVYSKNEKLGKVYFEEVGWRSKIEFLKQLEGIDGITFLGTDTDIQRLKFCVYRHNEEDEVDEVMNVYAAGIHASQVGKRRVYTYVEPGLSINTFGIQGTHRLQGAVPSAPQIRKAAKPEPGDAKLQKALANLLDCNRPEIVVQLVGWCCACHLKAHILGLYNQFPVLNLWGEAGSGKTFSAMLFAFLNGVDYKSFAAPVSLSLATPWPIIENVSSTTTIPRLLEEFNQSKMKKYGMYELCTEVMKAAWNNHPVPRGTLSRSRSNGQQRTGAVVVELAMSGPIIVCSEQPPQIPALRQRMLQVQMTTAGRKGRTPAFNTAMELQEELMSFARALTMMAIKTQDSWVKEHYEACQILVPDILIDRPRFSYAVIMLGLDFFHSVCESLNLDLNLKISELRQSLLDYLVDSAEELSQFKTWSEVDILISAIGEMAQLAIQDSALSPLVEGKNFLTVKERDELVLDMRVIYPMYRRHARITGDGSVFANMQQLEPLLKSEPYYVTNERVIPQVAGGRKLWVLSLSELENKGHDTAMFMR